MHELSLCQAICESVARYADGREVRRVDVRVGYLRQVVPESLHMAWELLTEHTNLGGAELVIEHVPAVVLCSACGAETTLDWPVLMCGACERTEVGLRSGEELDIVSIDVAAPDQVERVR